MSWWFIIGFIIFLILSTLITLFYLKRDCFVEEGFQTTNQRIPEIYLVSNVNNTPMSYTDAENACLILGGRLAIATEVYNGAVAGANWSTPGWIGGDGSFGYCPVSTGNTLDSIVGPAIVRRGAEQNVVDCNGSYRDKPAKAGICYGILPTPLDTSQTATSPPGTVVLKEYNLFVGHYGEYRYVLKSTNLNNELALSDTFDDQAKKTYTILDLDAINTQKNIITIDIQNIKKTEYDYENQAVSLYSNGLLNGDTPEENLEIINTRLARGRTRDGYTITESQLSKLTTLKDSIAASILVLNPLKADYLAQVKLVENNRSNANFLADLSNKQDKYIAAENVYNTKINEYNAFETEIINGEAISRLSRDQIIRIKQGFLLLKYHLDILIKISNIITSVNFVSSPLKIILDKFILARNTNRSILFEQYIVTLLDNINNYYNDIILNLKSHPLAYLQSGVLNMTNYVNSFGLIPLRPGTLLDDNATWYYKTLNQNGLVDAGEIRKELAPPYAGCGIQSYRDSISEQGWQNPGISRTPFVEQTDDNKLRTDYHCPGGRWWYDMKRVRGDINARDVGKYYYNTTRGGYVFEYPTLDQTITIRDVNLNKIPRTQTYYDTTFLSTTDVWSPKAHSTDSQPILTKFLEEKTKLARLYNKPVENTYRWKPVKYVGTITEENIREAKKSAAISAIFNFTDYTSIEKQIRISSAPPFNLSYSKLYNAKSEYVHKLIPSSRTPNNNGEILAGLTYASMGLTILSAAISIRAGYKGIDKVSKLGTGLGLTGSLLTIGSAAAIGATSTAGTAANFTLAAENADYNDTVCTPFTAEIFNLLPYQTREYIGFWSFFRKQRILDWYITNVLSDTGLVKNSEGGPYAGSPNAKIKSDNWKKGTTPGSVNFTVGKITKVGDISIYDISSNFFNSFDEYSYKINETNTINSINDSLIRNKIYDAIAQSYYNLNNGEAYITKILDVYQIGKTLYDVRFTESRRSSNAGFRNKIENLKSKHNTYRNMNLSEKQLNNLESNYISITDTLYEKEGRNLVDSASNCGVSAQIIKITKIGNVNFNLSQIIAINNYGQNVLYLKNVTATSTYLESYESYTNKRYYDNNNVAYTIEKSAELAENDNKIVIKEKLMNLTDGTYTKRYDSFYKNESSDTNAAITIDSGSSFDISLVKLIHADSMNGGRFKVELFNKDNVSVGVKEFTCGSTSASGSASEGSTIISFLRDRSTDETPCPTDIYSYNKVARFYATVDSVILAAAMASGTPSGTPSGRVLASPSGRVLASPLTFTGYAEGTDAALTFNPLYNAGFTIDITSLSGNVIYKPVTIFNMSTKVNLMNCSEPERIRSVFKDHLFNVNTSEFRNMYNPEGRPSGRPSGIIPFSSGSTSGTANSSLISKLYDVNYLYKPSVVTKAINASTDSYECAYVWKENVHDAENGEFTGNQVERYGVFKYKYDNENWLSRGTVYDINNTIQFSDLTTLQNYLNTNVPQLAREVSLYLPYWDSVTLNNNRGRCATTDCSDPSVINSIVSIYNNYSSIPNNSKILRITKALTTADNRCEYEYITTSSLTSRLSIEVIPTIDENGICSYIPVTNNFNNEKYPSVKSATYLNDDTPLLARAYNYASDAISPYVNTLSYIYNDLYNKYIDPQFDSYGDGIKGDLIRYRTTTNTAAGQIRHVSIINEPVIDEYGNTCTTKCNSPEIIKSFYKYFNNKGDEKVTSIQNAGMDTSGNCDFTYTAAPVIINNGSPQIDSASGQTRGVKFKIARYLNSCDYFITGSDTTIMPIPDMNSILDFNTKSPSGGRRPSGISRITTAGVNSLGPSGTNAAIPIKGPAPSGIPLIASGFPSFQNTLLENVDYIDCFSKYAMNSISQLGNLTASLTGISQVDTKTCAIKMGTTENHYKFGPNTSVLGVSAPLVPSITAPKSTTFTPVTPVSFTTLVCNPAVSCDAPSTKALTGFANAIVSSKTISSDTCEYKITENNTLPFENTFVRVGFYTDRSLTSLSGTDLHIKSISNSSPANSPYSYFQNANIRISFIDDYMKLLQYLRYTWNEQFYKKNPTNTRTWKIGKISGIGILLNEDAFVIEAESCLYGLYGPYDIRDYNTKRYFKFTVRIDTLNGTDTNNYSVSPYSINNIRIYKSESSATSYGAYRIVPSGSPVGLFSLTTTQYNTICTYNGLNYNSQWYDIFPTAGSPPENAPQIPYIIQTIEDSLKNNRYYNRVRFTVNKSPMGIATKNSDGSLSIQTLNTSNTDSPNSARAEIAKLMFYNQSTINTYVYQNIPNATVEVQDISSTYLLAQSEKNKCDKNFREIVDPETGIIECIYTGDIQQQYTRNTACNTGDTEVSKVGDTYTCLPATVYTKPVDVACGIGYFGERNGTKCNLIGDFYDVIQNPSIVFNTNSGVPRLRMPLGKYTLVNFNKIIRIDGFSFITGSAGTLPLQWNLEASMNGIHWRTIHCRSVDYNYSDARPNRVNNIDITSFFTPGIFLTNKDGASGSTCTVPIATTGATTTAGNSAYNVSAYYSLAQNITEGFKAGEAPSLESIFKTPLLQNNIPSLKPIKANVSAERRILNLKFKILETYDPNSKFVHMSSLDLMSHSGKIPASLIKLSNLHGSRSTPKEGVNALLEGPQKRWVDYNKSDINIQISEAAGPITGFRFSIPQGFPDSMNAMPIKWILYGSYDRRNWHVLHEFSGTSLPLINSFATVVFKLDEEI